MTSDERLSEVAGIFAAGVLRLHARAARSCDDPPVHDSPWTRPTPIFDNVWIVAHIEGQPLDW